MRTIPTHYNFSSKVDHCYTRLIELLIITGQDWIIQIWRNEACCNVPGFSTFTEYRITHLFLLKNISAMTIEAKGTQSAVGDTTLQDGNQAQQQSKSKHVEREIVTIDDALSGYYCW